MSLLEDFEEEAKLRKKSRVRVPAMSKNSPGERWMNKPTTPKEVLGWAGLEDETYADMKPTVFDQTHTTLPPRPMIDKYGEKKTRNEEVLVPWRDTFKNDYGGGYDAALPDSMPAERRLKVFEAETGLNPSVMSDEEYNRYVGPDSKFKLPSRLDYEQVPVDDGFGPSIKRTGDVEESDFSDLIFRPEGEEVEVSEEVSKVEVGGSGGSPASGSDGKRKIVTPDIDPDEMFRKSRDEGVPWQDIIIAEYTAKHPWISPTKIKEAVYNTANKHFDKYVRENKSSSGYKSNLMNSMRGGRKGGGKKYGKSRDNSRSIGKSLLGHDGELNEYLKIMRGANNFTKGIADQEYSKFIDKTEAGDNTGAVEETMIKIKGKSNLTKDAYVEREILDRVSYDENGKKLDKKNTSRWNRSRLQALMIKRMDKRLRDLYLDGDREIVEFVDKYKTGKKAGSPAFTAAAKNIYLGFGLEDVTKSRGNRHAGKTYKNRGKKK